MDLEVQEKKPKTNRKTKAEVEIAYLWLGKTS